MCISNRLLQIVEYVGINANAFAAKIGVSQPRFRNYLNGRVPNFETIQQICITFVIIDERWLLTGEGEMLKTATDERPSQPATTYKSDTTTDTTRAEVYLSMYKDKDKENGELQREIGELRERAKSLQKELSQVKSDCTSAPRT